MASSIALDRDRSLVPALRGTGMVIGLAAVLGVLLWVGYFLAVAIAVGVLVSPLVILVVGLATGVRSKLWGGSVSRDDEEGDGRESRVDARVRVVEVHGECALGQRFHAGQVFTFKDGHVEPELCPLPCSRLQSWIGSPPAGQGEQLYRLVCRDADHRVVFRFQGNQETTAPGRTPNHTSGRYPSH